MPAEVNINVDGIRDTVIALKELDQPLMNKLRREVRKAGESMVTDARGRAPEQTGAMRKGYRITTSVPQSNAVGFYFANMTRADAILGWAGSASQGNTQRGQRLIAGLTRRYGAARKNRSRFMWPAYERGKRQLMLDIERITAEIDAELQRKFDRSGR